MYIQPKQMDNTWHKLKSSFPNPVFQEMFAWSLDTQYYIIRNPHVQVWSFDKSAPLWTHNEVKHFVFDVLEES